MKDYLKGKKGFWWLLIYELVSTMSNDKSWLSSKRLERLALFWLAYWIVIGFVKRKWDTLEVSDMLMIVGTLLGAGLMNVIQARKDAIAGVTPKKEETTTIPS